MSSETIIRANGVDLCVEAFGASGDPAILLIAGAGASMDWWDAEFCERLVSGSRFVIRYDLRDTGRSVSYPPGAPGYTGDDLVADAVGVLDALGLASAHLVGISMGGAIAQVIALDHPDRVEALTLIATSPAGPGPDDPDLPAMAEEAGARFAGIPEPDWSDRTQVIDYIVALERACSGSGPFDEVAFEALAGRAFDRTTNIESALTNHDLIDGGGRWRDRLGAIAVPTLVVHGTEDPVLPYGNGLALAREIPGAELLTLDRIGHELPPRTWDAVVPAILGQASGHGSR